MRMIIIAAMLLLSGCATTSPQAVEIRTVEVIKEVQVPCPATAPARPDTINPNALPPNAVDSVRLLFARLLEWQGSGGYADKAEAAIEICAGIPTE